jgi:hypothetical protein
MPGKTLLEVREIAAKRARDRGHQIKRWRRHKGYRYTTICSLCRAPLKVFSRVIDGEPSPIGSPLVFQDRDLYFTGKDFNWAEGDAVLWADCPGLGRPMLHTFGDSR